MVLKVCLVIGANKEMVKALFEKITNRIKRKIFLTILFGMTMVLNREDELPVFFTIMYLIICVQFIEQRH